MGRYTWAELRTFVGFEGLPSYSVRRKVGEVKPAVRNYGRVISQFKAGDSLDFTLEIFLFPFALFFSNSIPETRGGGITTM